jgi:predicted nucleic acid-binding protein
VPNVIAAGVAVVPRSRQASVVVDASVAVKWVVAEEHSDVAQTLLEGDFALSAPAHWLAEAATGLWGACRRGELSEQQAQERVALLVGAPVAAVPLHGLANAAMGLAIRLNLTIYDTLYLALAEEQDARLITADRRLFEAARRDRRFRSRVRWIRDG